MMSIVGVHYAVDGPRLFRTDLARLGRSLRSICARHLVAKDTEEGKLLYCIGTPRRQIHMYVLHCRRLTSFTDVTASCSGS